MDGLQCCTHCSAPLTVAAVSNGYHHCARCRAELDALVDDAIAARVPGLSADQARRAADEEARDCREMGHGI